MILTRENMPLLAGVFILSALAALFMPGPSDNRLWVRLVWRCLLFVVFDVALLSAFTAAGVLK